MLTVIPHNTQLYNWDCGLACISMVLQGIGKRNCSPSDLVKLYNSDSVWTIDLVYLLKHFGVEDFTMYTTHIGINWQHQTTPFYKDLQKDTRRVHSLFAKARENDIRVVPSKLQMDDIRRFLMSDRYAIILLVNLNLLSCHLCKENQRKMWWKSLFYKKEKREVEQSTVVPVSDAIDVPQPSAPSTPTHSMSWSKSSPTLSGTSLRGANPPYTPTAIRPPTPSTPLLRSNASSPKPTCLGMCTSFGNYD
ncbi:hypothetical protein HK103_001564 [Boothiomyces macroporosus]|uniref:Guanylyl cyclase n=1 Tax=Boothiomyces macroporosus TaxID=261099 RepID=A0AAD5UE06_9FUNG|nr:hypothetical protein HK103_001564 [Boothiomyces macroporosus]